MKQRFQCSHDPIRSPVAAVSVGIVGGRPLLDLCYEEDSRADVDMNVVMTAADEFVELQGTAEGQTFSRATLDELTELATDGIRQLIAVQRLALGG
jgi:ribonuclease PH